MPSANPFPVARRSDVTRDFHGVSVPDPYDWLDDLGSAETRAWLKAQATLTRDALARVPDRSRITAILDALPRHWPDRLPIRRGEACFTFAPSSNGGSALVREMRGRAETVIDPARIEGLEGLRLAPNFTEVSPSGRYVAAGLAPAGSDWMRLHLFDLTGGGWVEGWDETAHLVVTWSPDESSFHHNRTNTSMTGALGVDGVYRHRLGAAADDDVLVFAHPEGEGHASLPAVTPRSGLLLVKTLDFVTQQSALYARRLGEEGPFRRLLDYGLRFNLIAEHDGELLIETQRGAAKGRVLAADPLTAAPEWREVVPEQAEALAIEAHSTWSPLSALAGDRLLLTYVKDAAHRVRGFDLAGRALGEVGLTGLFTALRVEAEGETVRVARTDFARPFVASTVDPMTLAAIDDTAVTAGPALERATTEQLFCSSRDGTRIPIFVVRPAGARGPLPTLLYGYGGWGQSITPIFREDLAVWVSLGGAYAVVNTRGGGEYGEAWREAGARLNRKATFEDFCAAGEALIERGVCQLGGLAARGLSNGGLMVAAAINLRPDLFAAAAVGIPLLDVVNLLRLEAGTAIAAELGDPTADQASFDYIASYSPLQNVKPTRARPAVMVSPAERDRRVSPGQALKYVAALQATAEPGQIALLRMIEGEGHGGWPWAVQRELLADELAFLWDEARKRAQGVETAGGGRHVAV